GPSAPPALATVPGEKTLFWFHAGVSGNSNYYGSHRFALGSPEAKPAADPPDPARPFEADLGDGVSVRVPLALPADAGHTRPRGRMPAAVTDAALASGSDRTTRLADVIVAWTVFEQFFPYFPDERVDWAAALRAALAAAATDADAIAFERTLSRLVAGLRDGHARVSSLSALPFG